MAEMEDLGLNPNDHSEALDAMEKGQDFDATDGGEGDVGDVGGGGVHDPELQAIKARLREMEKEAEKLKQTQPEVDKQMNLGSPPGMTSPLDMYLEEKTEVDSRSIYVGNVDYGATAEELEQHFHGCGSINRVTILCNKYDGHPKGFAYIEFAERESVQRATAMNESLFRGRQIKVMPKRTNIPGFSMTDRPPRGRGYRGGRGGDDKEPVDTENIFIAQSHWISPHPVPIQRHNDCEEETNSSRGTPLSRESSQQSPPKKRKISIAAKWKRNIQKEKSFQGRKL